MPWTTPTLKDVRKLTRDYVLTQLGAKAMIPNSVLRIMSDAMSGLANLTLLYIDWLSKQLLPDTSEKEWLDRHGDIWLVNADGSKGRKAATYAKGSAAFIGLTGTVVPQGALINAASGNQYQTLTQAVLSDIGANADIVSLVAGSDSNLPDGEPVSLVTPNPGVTSVSIITMSGGADAETDDQLRERVLRRIQQPPMGGDVADYEAWALAVPGVTRAWAASEMGIGTVTVRFMMDDLRADNGGFPLPQDIADVEAYLDTKRPVTVKDMFVVAPIPQPIDFNLASIQPDTPTIRGEIEASIKQMLLDYAAPGQTIFAAWKYSAVMDAPGIVSFDMITTTDDVMPSIGHMAVLGDLYVGPPQ